MFELESPNWIAVVVASVHLLQSATKDIPVSGCLSLFNLGWIIAGLLFVHPLILKGSWMAMSVGYLLMGVLIVNTLILSVVSVMPRRVVSYKSEGLEKVGLMFTGFVCAGFVALFKQGIKRASQLLSAKYSPQESELSIWSNI